MLKIKIKSFLLASFIGLQLLTPNVFASFLNASAYGTDTVAGYASLLKSSVLTANKNITFVVEKPDLSVVRIPAQTDIDGIAKADLYGHQTKMAGVYKVSLYYTGSSDTSAQSVFSVYPDQVSKTQSMLLATTKMLEASSEDHSFVRVTLYDAYRNPIKDHQVKLFSSRPKDVIEAINTGITDENGRASFKVYSDYVGVSVYTAMDVSSNVILDAREELVFYAPIPKEIGGNFLLDSSIFQANIMESSNDDLVIPGPVDHFEIEGLKSTIKVNTDQTLTIVAKDKDGNIAKNYMGSILISTPDDENAILPNNGEYTFKEADQGKFTFNLALRFSHVGNQFVQVLDKNNWKISGEKSVEIIPQQAVNVSEHSSSLQIKSPTDGGRFGSNLIVITGQGDPNINLKIFDDDIKIADTETDSDGFFTYQAKNLSSGSHTFYLMSEDGQVSQSVSISIDINPPVLNSISIHPDGAVHSGEMIRVSISSEPNLDSVLLRIQGLEKELYPEAGQSGTYAGSFSAPSSSGSYPIDLLLVDDLGNKSEFKSQKTILVGEDELSYPPKVENVEGISSDSEIILSWDPVKNHTSSISSYHIFYGTSYENLDKNIQSSGDSNILKIENLLNGTQYFFSVKAVDSKGLESEESSVVISVTPNSNTSLSENDSSNEDNQTNIESEFLNPSAEAQEASENATMNIGAGASSSLYHNPLNGSSTVNSVTLTWQDFPGVHASRYKIYFGIKSGNYSDYIITPDNRNNFIIKDLIAGVNYYFSVVALDVSGNEISPLSEEFNLLPQKEGFQPSSESYKSSNDANYASILDNSKFSQVPKQEDSGMKSVWIVILSISLASFFFYFNKKHLFERS